MWHSVIDIYSIHISRLYGSLHNKELIQGLIAQTFTIERKDISKWYSPHNNMQETQRLHLEHKLLFTNGKIASCDTISYLNGFQSRLYTRTFEGSKVHIKEYMLKGYAINQRIEQLEKTVALHSEKIDFFVRTSLPPVEGIFFDGQIFDAYKFATDLIRSARKSLLLIDNYVDESVLLMLSKRNPGVSATIYTQKITAQLQLDLDKHNDQYPPINIRTYRNSHDRFLIVDDKEVYHIGASLKDLGKKMFAFSKLEIDPGLITDKL